MKNFNLSVIEGYLVRKPDFKKVNNGRGSLCKFVIGNNRDYKNTQGELVPNANFIEIVTWSHLAEICQRNLDMV